MQEVLLVRFGEVHLKGLNRPYFLRRLTENVKRAVANLSTKVWLNDSRIYISGIDDMAACIDRAKDVFGVYSVSPAIQMEKDFEAIAQQCVAMMKGREGTFKVMARRSDKKFPVNSQDMGAEIGGRILEANPRLKVDVHKPQIKMSVEIRDAAYLYNEEIMAVGGLPMGTSGKAMLLLSGGIDSPVAGYQLMRRGVSLQAIHFASPPYTSERAREKVIALARRLAHYGGGGIRVHMVPFTDIQMLIHEKCPEEYTTLVMRRFMMRIANELARQNDAQALITGESLGQVASQTMEALGCTDCLSDIPVFRPLIGLDKLEIIHIAEAIDTYETSILPYEDCCTVFTPRHPSTRPKVSHLERAEQSLAVADLVATAVERTETLLVMSES